ncbi:MAG: helix-turn-helix domain-containing protein [Planctomycetota bacterium]|jgi:excisionase family DNA binding protein|nr:helix-turn-helix domain-containing protein [Planctomycetota bacterium]
MNTSEEDDDSSATNREGESALVDAKEAARLCCISESMLYKLNTAGKMPAPVRLGSLLRWKRRELLEWIEAGCPEETGGKNNRNAHNKHHKCIRNR